MNESACCGDWEGDGDVNTEDMGIREASKHTSSHSQCCI